MVEASMSQAKYKILVFSNGYERVEYEGDTLALAESAWDKYVPENCKGKRITWVENGVFRCSFEEPHNEEYERLKEENKKEEFTRGWNAALQTYPPKESHANAQGSNVSDFIHFLCTGEATPQLQELFSPLVSNKTVPVPTERSHRPATLGSCKGQW
jgi:hypothetical protein